VRPALLLGLVVAAVLALGGIALATNSSKARMVSTKLGPRLCETVGGGKFVAIPEFPGERIDRRLLTDLAWLESKYKIFVTDAYSMDSVHAQNGEHPIGLAADIVPNRAAGGTWNDVDRLAAWAEPVQNEPRTPFRWVGYDGDSGHGRGDHLHLSWDHSETKPGIPAVTVDTIFCPTAATTPVPTPPVAPPTGATQPHGHTGSGQGTSTTPPAPAGGGGGGGGGGGASSSPGGGVRNGGRSSSGSGGVAGRAADAPPVLGPVGPGYNDH
jgi:uncharacterized membrane protein YgcG